MEPATAVFPLCTHTRPDGSRCAAPALRGMNLCFHHIGGRTSHLRATSTYSVKLDLVPAGTREAIQHNLSVVALALSDGKIDIRTANTYLRFYRTAEQNLTRWEKANKDNPDKQMLPLSDEAGADGPLKRNSSGQQASTATTDVIPNTNTNAGAPCLAETWDQDQPSTDVFLSEESAANEVEGPAFRNADSTSTHDGGEQTTSNTNDQEQTSGVYDPLKDKTLFEGMKHKYPSIEYTYELRDRIQKRHQEQQARIRAC